MTATLATSVGPGQPYVGLRPFERDERHLLRGRDQDAAFLVDKILVGPMTLLYAQSGVGKSSLLQALVVPDLEAEGSVVVYHDAWCDENPLAGLKAALIAKAAALGVPSPAAGAPTLAELVALLGAINGQRVVLVLDQFEEFLFRYAEALDPLRKELATLIHASGSRAHVVLSLREEFLAALEPFRNAILSLFKSTYRLEPLSAVDVARAIEEPALPFGVLWEPALVRHLSTELRAHQLAAAEPGGGMVDLPFMQLVCQELWRQREGASSLTLATFHEKGGVGGVLRSYLSQVMPRRPRARVLCARLLHFLAPPSGLKMSYSVEDLAGLSGRTNTMIEAELRRLETRRVLHKREFRGKERFELQHDALIRVLGPWRDRVLRRARAAKQLASLVGGLILLLGVLKAVTFLQEREQKRELVRETHGAVEEALGRTPGHERDRSLTQALDAATGEVLFSRPSDAESLNFLERFLTKYQDRFPPDYATDSASHDHESIFDPRDSPDFRLFYSDGRRLDIGAFEAGWRRTAQNLARAWGLPVSTRLALVEDAALPVRQVRFAAGDVSVVLTLPICEDEWLVDARDLPAPVAGFFQRFGAGWRTIDEASSGVKLTIVPRWSLPVWKASGHLVLAGSEALAVRVWNELLRRPEAFVSDSLLERLLQEAAQEHPQAVVEARAARGDRLRADLREMVRSGPGLRDLDRLLELLAEHPDEDAATVATRARRDTKRIVVAAPTRLPARPADRAVAAAMGQSRDEPPIRVYLGTALKAALTVEGLKARTEEVRRDVYARYGLRLPLIQYRGASDRLAPHEAQILLLNQVVSDDEAKKAIIASADPESELLAAVAARVAEARQRLLTTEAVTDLLSTLRPATRDWIRARLTPTDVKVLLRAVIGPDACDSGPCDSATSAKPEALPLGATLGEAPWLLDALVFLATRGELADVPFVVRSLRDLQAARLDEAYAAGRSAPAASGSSPTADRWRPALAQAVALLADGKIERAFVAFQRLPRGPDVEAEFVLAWTRIAQQRRARSVAEACAAPENAVDGPDTMFELQRRVFDAKRELAPEATLKHALCLLAQSPHHARGFFRLAEDVSARFGDVGSWETRWASWFAPMILRESLQWREAERLRPFAERLTERLMRSLLEQRQDSAAAGLIEHIGNDTCSKTGPESWCLTLQRRLVGDNPSPRIEVVWALQLAWTQHTNLLEEAVTVAQKVAEAAEHLTPSDRQVRLRARLAEGRALASLYEYGAAPNAGRAEELLRSLANDPQLGRSADLELVQLLAAEGRADAATRVFEASVRRNPGEAAAWGSMVNLLLHQGDGAALENLAARLRKLIELGHFKDQSLDAKFYLAMALTMTRAPGWESNARTFIRVKHEYADYIRLLLASSMDVQDRPDATRLLENVWSRDDTVGLAERLERGDERGWHQLLAGYFLGKVQRSQIFDDLEDENRYLQSSFHKLPLPHRGMLCEAYFYDALKSRRDGHFAAMKDTLRKVIATGTRGYFEYAMARYLLKEGSPSATPLADGPE